MKNKTKKKNDYIYISNFFKGVACVQWKLQWKLPLDTLDGGPVSFF